MTAQSSRPGASPDPAVQQYVGRLDARRAARSHDRLLGAQGVLRGLIDRGAAGLITTHDLALTAIADDLAPRAVNVHFEDWFEGREMRFDYRMKPGPVGRSNALALMPAVGLEVATLDPNGATLLPSENAR